MTNAAGSTGISSEQRPTGKSQSKIMITGDDILIEYVARLVKVLSSQQSEILQSHQLSSMERFVTHYVWKQPDQVDLN